MKYLTTLLAALVLATSAVPTLTIASAGTLRRCDGISTREGFKYVGTYCADYACSYTFTRVFDSYCPFSL